MIKNIESIIFEESYLLGWNQSGKDIELNIEFMLTEEHPLYHRYNKKNDYGCYKVGSLLLHNVSLARGFSSSSHNPVWNDEVHEFKDIAEINCLSIEKANDSYKLKISAEEFDFEIIADKLDIAFLNNIKVSDINKNSFKKVNSR